MATKLNAMSAAQRCANALKEPAVYYQTTNGQWMFARKRWWDEDNEHRSVIERKTLIIVEPSKDTDK